MDVDTDVQAQKRARAESDSSIASSQTFNSWSPSAQQQLDTAKKVCREAVSLSSTCSPAHMCGFTTNLGGDSNNTPYFAVQDVATACLQSPASLYPVLEYEARTPGVAPHAPWVGGSASFVPEHLRQAQNMPFCHEHLKSAIVEGPWLP